jgi:hypothetical protein
LLDDTTHNVGVEDILAPRGTIDSGQTIIPRCIVANYGDSAESLWAFMVVDAGAIVHSDSLWLPALAPARRETIAFIGWAPECRDSATAIAWTACAGDTYPQNDTCRVRFLVRVKRIDVHIIEPQNGDTFDSGIVITPMCRVTNSGNVSLNFDLRFRVYPGHYIFTRNLNLPAGCSTDVSGLPFSTMPGEMMLTVEVPGFGADTSRFWVRGGAGVEETPNFKLRTPNTATVMRALPAGAVVFDATGRRVLSPKAGVYFIREQSAFSSQHSGAENGARSTVHVRKVILQR